MNQLEQAARLLKTAQETLEEIVKRTRELNEAGLLTNNDAQWVQVGLQRAQATALVAIGLLLHEVARKPGRQGW